jgi:4-phospho-D-threonate 3-dehydrogenase / 4-phospho-D-erythronate 3-dehydrogenase
MNADSASRPKIAISLGDPAGIGPEVVAKALADPEILRLADWTVVGDAEVLSQVEAQTHVATAKLPNVHHLDLKRLDVAEVVPGKLSAECGRAALEYVRVAARMCLEGEADAVVTAPVNKEAVTLSRPSFTGHTEYIAELCGVSEPRMLLVNDRLHVVHVSSHVSLRKACELDSPRILRTIELGHEAAQWLGVERPRIAVCGLNPHAGEHGLFGEEDRLYILPAVKTAQAGGIRCDGPFPADTIFLKAVRGAYDLVVAMYHDQGHVPMKLLDFEHTVNVSLGLPILRTSVDHGTAFDIAGKNQADPSSMKAAMKLAAVMAAHRSKPGSKAKAII